MKLINAVHVYLFDKIPRIMTNFYRAAIIINLFLGNLPPTHYLDVLNMTICNVLELFDYNNNPDVVSYYSLMHFDLNLHCKIAN